jgi:OPA family glycerol-3-phosphate transporter-like MFS transporter
MEAAGYDLAYTGGIAFFFFMCYGIGQLINGFAGDKFNPKWMICIGLFGSGITNIIFTLVIASPIAANATYGMTGIFLSMIYGPMTKIVAENTEPLYATRCSLGYTFSSLLATPSAQIFAMFLIWESVFGVSSALLILMSFLAFVFFSAFEKRGVITYGQYKAEEKGIGGGVSALIKRGIIKMAIISIITGVIRTSLLTLMKQYFIDYLGFDSTSAGGVAATAAIIISLTAFISIFVYEKIGYKMNITMFLFFILSVIFFILTYFVTARIPNIIFFVLAIMSSIAAANMIFSRYSPSLRDTGMVSTATGFLDFLSYMSAAVASAVFGSFAEFGRWTDILIICIVLMLIGVVLCIPRKNDPIEPPSDI